MADSTAPDRPREAVTLIALTSSPDRASALPFLWAGASLSYLAFVLTRFLLPVIAATITRDPATLSAIAIAQAAPWLGLGLLAGAIVDRLDRRRLQLAMNGLRLAALLALLLGVIAGRVSPALLIAIAAVLGLTDTFIDTAQAALVPAVVPPDRLDHANGRLFAARTAAEILAMPLAGVLAARGFPLAVGAAIVSVGLAVAAWRLLPGSFVAPPAGRRPLWRETWAGLHFLWHHRLLRTITIMAAVINACWSAWGALLVLYAIAPGPLGLDAFTFGVLLTASGLGGLAGSLLATSLQRWLGRRAAFGINIGVNTVMFGVTAVTANPWLVAPALFIGDVGGPLWGIATLSLQARTTPDALRGRVASAYRFVSFGAMALGPLAGGVLATRLGVQGVFGVCAVATGAMAIPFARIVTERALDGSPATGASG